MDPVPESLTATFSRCIDQRHFEMPATWVSLTTVDAPASLELGESVHRSGRNRQVAVRVAKLISRANRLAVVGSFLLADTEVVDAILAAAKRGVRVYLLLASEARLGKEPGDGEFEQRVYAEHKDLLRELAGHVLVRSAPHFHAKFVLIDPSDAPAGMLLTANLTREALERNEELAIDLRADEVRDATALVRWAMWEAAEHELIDGKDFHPVRALGSVAHPASSSAVAATTPEAAELANAAWDVIEGANEEVVVSSFGWAAHHTVVEYLCDRARDGLRVTVLARVRPRPMAALVALAEAGANVLGFKWLHAKALWADSGKALVMSANLEPHGLDEGFELGVRLDGQRADEVRMRLRDWAARAAFELRPRPTLGQLQGDVKVWFEGEFKDVSVAERADLDLGSLEAESAADLERVPDLPVVDGLGNVAHELRCRWQVTSPSLHRKAREIRRTAPDDHAPSSPYRPPVFIEPGGRTVVAIRSGAEVADAKLVAREVDAAAIVVDCRGRER